MGLHSALYDEGMREFGPGVAVHSGFVAVSPLIVRAADETGNDLEAVATDEDLCESGYSQEPIIVQFKMGADPFDKAAQMWVIGRCAWEDATRWLSEFPWITPGPDLWVCVNLDYSIGTPALRRLLRYAASAGAMGADLCAWLLDFAPDAVKEPFCRWWGRANPKKVAIRIPRQVNRVKVAAQYGSLAPRLDATPPSATLPAGCAPMPDSLKAICRRILAAQRVVNRAKTDAEKAEAKAMLRVVYDETHAQVRGYARALDRQRRRRPVLVKLARLILPREMRHPEAAVARRAA